MTDFPISLSAVTDNVDDVMAKHLNNLEAKLGIDGSSVVTSHDYILTQLKLGWIYADESWSYNAANKINVPSGAASIYQKGDKIKLTQVRSQAYTNDPAAGDDIELEMVDTSGFNVGNIVTVSSSAGSEQAKVTVVDANVHITVDTLALDHTTTNPLVYIGNTIVGTKWFYIIDVADTILTTTSGDDYTLEDAAISNNFYSKAENPQGFPGRFNWTPTIVGTGDTGVGTYATQVGTFSIHGITCIFSAYCVWTNHTGTGNLTMSLPVSKAEGYFSASIGYVRTLTLPADTVQLVGLGNNAAGSNIGLSGVIDASDPIPVVMDTAARLLWSGSYEI